MKQNPAPMQMLKPVFGILLLCGGWITAAQADTPTISTTSAVDGATTEFDYNEALKTSQGAIGNQLGNHRFMTSTGEVMHMQALLGKPLVISLVYSSCYHTCPMTTRNLAKVVEKARDALGEEAFNVALIGFDTEHDTPSAMRYFGRQQDVNDKGWNLLSTDQATIGTLAKELGFIYYPSPRGFDHLVQTTVVDAEGKVYRQVYGEVFDTPLLIEPLKDLVYGRASSENSFITDIANKVKLFCTTYDPIKDTYVFDYSLFLGILIGLSIIVSGIIFVVREWRRTSK